MTLPGRTALPGRAAWYGVPALVVVLVWAPLVSRYYVRAATITQDMVRQARRSPPDSVLQALNQLRLLKLGPARNELLRVAEELRRGAAGAAGYPPVSIGYPPVTIEIPADPGRLEKALPAWQPYLVVPRILLDAYDVTGRDELLLRARDMIVAWGRRERRALLPTGLLWNDDAIAVRIGVLTEFWQLYRHHPGYQPAVAQAVLEQVDRSAKLLARQGLFTFNTNHGVMQNLALLQVSVAFPMLPDAEHYRELGLARLRDQMPFYIDQEGVVLEDSPEYQGLGLQLMAVACRYLTLLHVTIPQDWRTQYERAEQVFAALRRPDGTLPGLGDTDGASDSVGPLVAGFDTQGRAETVRHRESWVPAGSLSSYPVAGDAVWWDGLAEWPNEMVLRQTVIHWSSFPGHAHQHADEMSVVMWAGGQLWWTNVGYWPYATAGRSEAESWEGSDAPHLLGESAESHRSTRLLASGWSDRLAVVDLERRGPGDYVARRQVVHIRPDVWLVVDNVSAQGGGTTTTTWTTAPDVSLERGNSAQSYVLTSPRHGVRLRAFVFGSPSPTIKHSAGSLSPFAGWQVVNGTPRPAAAIVIKQPARDAWSIMVWSLEGSHAGSNGSLAAPHVLSWKGPDDWSVGLGAATDVRQVGREQDRMTVRDARSNRTDTLELTPGPDVSAQVVQINAAFATAQAAYPRFDDLLGRRTKVTLLLLVVFLGQELVFWFIRRRHNAYYRSLRAFNLVGWIGAGWWLMGWFLKG